MKKTFRLLLSVSLLLSLAAPLLADTIRLKDGSVIRGQVIGFKDQQFTILIGGNARGRRGQTTVYVEDVESIEFDSTAGAATATDDGSMARNNPPLSNRRSDPEPAPSEPRIDSTPTNSSAPPTFFTIKVGVRADSANNGWTNSGLVVRKGQRLRISASGRVSLGRGRFSTPVGRAIISIDFMPVPFWAILRSSRMRSTAAQTRMEPVVKAGPCSRQFRAQARSRSKDRKPSKHKPSPRRSNC
jgi:hypothetical protein